MQEYFGIQDDSKTLKVNGYRDDSAEGGPLSQEEVKAFRGLAARLNFMAQDDLSLQFAAKEVCRRMSCPTDRDYSHVKKLARFLIGTATVVWDYEWQQECETNVITVHVDSDWAGCEQTRRSTSGGVIACGRHVLRTWSSTQPVVALSSAEAELYAMVEGTTRGLGLQTMLRELGVETDLILATDSSGAKSHSSTRGLGRMRHIEVKNLFLQDLVQQRAIVLKKVNGTTNPADMLTKYHCRDSLGKLLSRVGVRVVGVGSC